MGIRLKRALLILLALCVLGGVTALGISGWVVHSQRDRIVSAEDPNMADPGASAELDAILVLGCGLDEAGRPKPMLHDRMTVAIDLYNRGWADRLILSGDGTRAPGYDEPGAMETFALEREVPKQALVLDREGVNTDASIRRARDEFGMKRIVIVTQQYHLYRALYLAEAYGLEAYGVSATLRTYGPKQVIWSAREVLARDKDFARMLLSQ